MRENVENVKKEIRSVLITYPKGIVLEAFLRAYKQLIGVRLPTRDFGFISDIDFLYSLVDVVRIQTDKNGDYHLNCIADEATEHIQKLVVKQRISKPKPKKFSYGQSREKTVKDNRQKAKPFVSAPLRKYLFQVLSDYPEGISYHSLLVAYQKKLNRPLNLDWLSESYHDRFQKLAISVPELEVRVINDTERLFYYPLEKNSCSEKLINEGVRSLQSPTHRKTTLESNVKSQTDIKEDDISAIPRVVRDGFEKVLKLYPDGVFARYFPFLYEKVSGEIFDLLDLGYNNFLELADALPDIFICVKSYESRNDWILFHPIFSENASRLRDANAALEIADKRKKETINDNRDILLEIALPSRSYSQPQFPSDINLSVYIPVFISAIVSPSCFWFKLQTEEVICRFRELEEEMQCFYHSCSGDAFRLAQNDVEIGTTCAALHEDHWYRATITSSPNDDHVNVYLVDYGSWEKVRCSRLRYLKNSFIKLPSQAFKAQLASVKPAKEAKTWCKRAEARFLQLCNNSYIMAHIHLEFDDMVSVFLCDTSEEEDVHINDTLIDEGLAESCPTDVVRWSSLGDSYQNSEAHENGDIDDISKTTCSIKGNSANCLSQKVKVNEAGLRDISVKSTKLVKRISLGDGYKIHVIEVIKEAYVSAAELCHLFWCNKPAELLKERLEFKNVEIPTISISKEEYTDLFQQCESYAVQGFQKATVHQYSVVMYPLTCVMKVLNSLGHPSINVRETIKSQLETLRSLDSEWSECYDSVDDLEEISNENRDDIDKYCMYDLKALYETVKYKRMKLQRIYDETSCDSIRKELVKVEALTEIIKNRIDYIKSICSTYSSFEIR